MSEKIESLVLEHLRHIRTRVDRVADDMADVKVRLTSLETQVAGLHLDMAHMHSRIDRVDNRISRIETRLEIADA